MQFPGEMLIDYVRVYQRKGEINVGCDPKDYPTKKYIDDHLQAYTGEHWILPFWLAVVDVSRADVNMTTWTWPMPRNELWEGGC